MRAEFVKGALALSIMVCAGQRAAADDLVMPFACAISGGSVKLSPSAPATYAIAGARDERIHESCGLDDAGRQVCTHLAVHRFDIKCAGGVASWADVAQAARASGATLPSDMPAGYAPTSALHARIVLPPQARFTALAGGGVTREALSADSVLMPVEIDGPGATGAWSTVVRAEMGTEVPGRALRAGLAAGGVLGALLLIAFFFARQTREMPAAFDRSTFASIRRTARSYRTWFARSPRDGEDGERVSIGILNAVAMATARLAQAELNVSALSKDTGLRGVLQGELATVRSRLDAVERGLNSRPEDKSAAMVRAVLRDLERIGRIIGVAMRETNREGAGASREIALPQTLQDAYDILGLNSEAAPNVAKKLVDALRMTWHPDFARDEQDRQQREARMKQINAAWDMIKGQTAQAA